MTSGIIAELETELAALRQRLEQTEIYKDIQALERVIRIKSVSQPSAVVSQDSVPDAATVPSQPLRAVEAVERAGRAESATSSAFKAAVAQYLEGRTQPVSTKEIHDSLMSRGIFVPGDNPVNNLSAHLSRDDRFVSWGREGWTRSDVVTPLGAELRDVGVQFLEGLAGETQQNLRLHVRSAHGLPHELDKDLLTVARHRVGRHLLEEEKRELRKIVRELLWERTNQQHLSVDLTEGDDDLV
jgi:hypothetical protein